MVQVVRPGDRGARAVALALALALAGAGWLAGTGTAASAQSRKWVAAKVPWVTAHAGAPGASTATSATFEARIDPAGTPSAYCFDYGLKGTYDDQHGGSDPVWEDGETQPQFLPGTTVAVPVDGYVYGLRPATVYHYTVQVTNAGGDTMTHDRTFRTAG